MKHCVQRGSGKPPELKSSTITTRVSKPKRLGVKRFFIRSRKRLGLAKPLSRRALDIKQPLTVYIHHTADNGVRGDTLKHDRIYWQSIQAYHFSQDYQDIAYNFLISKKVGSKKKPRVYEGRGLGVLSAATMNHNHNSISICVAGNFEKQTCGDDVAIAIKKTIKRLKSLGANIQKVDVHRNVYPTSCCGKHLIQLLKEHGIV